ncbi:hypothetical protein S7711_10256 [Stachybotrys chartarum IBT 7711]|uniref:Uncharacterized protein n=1 Tax=Stachybotrys chartarum (strain CBS 109288 / IBT 7711) TaxID=1280523 RepID=A0A084AXS6_STACB|nr:hypothetical protein S7711_10256 [Stachybotrys chartarum IBT 7711]
MPTGFKVLPLALLGFRGRRSGR